MSGVTVLLYNLENDKGRKIEKFCRSIALKPVAVRKEDYNRTIESLLEAEGYKASDDDSDTESNTGTEVLNNGNSCNEVFDEEMLVMCGFNSRLLDIFLREYKKRHIEPVSLKAMLTEHNKKWSSVQLYTELCRERAAFTKR